MCLCVMCVGCNCSTRCIRCLTRNGYGSILPNMNGIEIPDPIANPAIGNSYRHVLYHFGKPRACLKLVNPSIFDFCPSTRVFDVSTGRRSEIQRLYPPPLFQQMDRLVACWLVL